MRRSFSRLLTAAVATLAVTTGAAANDGELRKPLPVVELFTSQGCSSCPAADALFATYAQREDVVALSLSVDYWDYLGWKDTLASGKFTARQRAYAAHRGDGEVYTPQVVVNGSVRAVGSDGQAIGRAVEIAAKRCDESTIKIGLDVTPSAMQIALTHAAPVAQPVEATVWVAVVRPEVAVTITKGENRGKTVTYHNVVRELIPVGLWAGNDAKLTLDRAAIMTSPGDRSAVLVQHGKGGPIIAAGWFPRF